MPVLWPAHPGALSRAWKGQIRIGKARILFQEREGQGISNGNDFPLPLPPSLYEYQSPPYPMAHNVPSHLTVSRLRPDAGPTSDPRQGQKSQACSQAALKFKLYFRHSQTLYPQDPSLTERIHTLVTLKLVCTYMGRRVQPLCIYLYVPHVFLVPEESEEGV